MEAHSRIEADHNVRLWEIILLECAYSTMNNSHHHHHLDKKLAMYYRCNLTALSFFSASHSRKDHRGVHISFIILPPLH
ncbi:hypothetical protein BDQ94DRAFT_134391 [Aspergillus welwitschiae]|uniref:Uncharacterized protein n=1 Tax=Aspergillus welwitschiae TaxID=1341132 RepID=A0A3F3QHQ6_9EURO|nr:hypothetical protein BDQ94DRAFT_134391 [Aspergillus welwitschiae]RDH38667.1 hypothetical protein BDQ94DRAFT_134391 [Aspergillus welwitschiae]